MNSSPGPHISDEDLAAFAEGGLDEPARARTRIHLAECRQCVATLAEIARYRAAWALDPGAFAAPPDVQSRAKAIAAAVEGGQLSPVGRLAGHRGRRRATGSEWRWAGVAGVIVAAVAIAIFAPRKGDSGRFPLSPQATEELQVAVRFASRSDMVLPGGDGQSREDAVVVRSGQPPPQQNLPAIIRRLSLAFERDHSNAEVTRLLVSAFLASARVAEARGILNRYQGTVGTEILVLDAVTSYRECRFDRSEELLRRAVALNPESAEAVFDLGLLLHTQSRFDEAAPWLREIIERFPHSSLAARATEMLASRDL